MTENIQEELLLITNDFWQALADRDIEKRFLHCADPITFIGTGLDEKAMGKSAYIAINQKGVEQYPEKFKLSILWQRVSVIDDMGWVECETEWVQVINGKEEMTLIRNTIVLKKINGQWKIVHVHGSVPDFRLAGQNYITNAETIKINRELEREVYQRTKELNAKNQELEIEASLERVRTVAMSMRKPDDMLMVCEAISNQLQLLQVKEIRNVQTAILGEGENASYMNYQYFAQYKQGVIEIVEIDKHPKVREMIDQMQKSPEAFFSESFVGKAFDEWRQYRKDENQFLDPLLDQVEELHFYFFSIGEGGLGISAYIPLAAEEIELFQRFRNVFALAYQRFRDIQHAEGQARVALIEAGLERVRSRTMAMQSCDELAETASVVLYELVKLGIAPSRLYIAIIENDSTDVHFYLTSEEGGKDCSVYTAQVEKNTTIRKMYNGWADHRSSLSLNMEGDELISYFDYLRDEVGVPFKSTQNPSRRVQTIAYFSQGYIGIASPDDQPEETTKLLERFAAVFNLTYTRFNDLKQAEKLAHQANLDLIRLKEEKAKTELALTELKATQAQLIQAEKMASLGELTAGIAHEIQNPLNFVNNFSEVNTELIEEMREELQSGNTEEAIAIANDIAENEQKINHHGKRADAIVKGMLQHSRSSSGIKESTDINALCDEYLRLAYHGLRAKDKSFNASMKTDFDESIGMVNVVPQDIGRVILNLITNAFYVVNEKKKHDGNGFEPTVSVITKKVGQLILITINDNGNGIPKEVVNKIFQPFFTTKPTGQGTGLGLSLSFDIVKAHGGDILLETTEGVGTTFIIQIPLS